MSWGVEPKLARTGGAARAHAMAIAPTAIHRHGPVVIVLTTRRVGLGIEKQYNRLAPEVRQLYGSPVLVEEGEVGGAIAWFEHERILEGSAGASFRSWRSGVSAPLALASRGRSLHACPKHSRFRQGEAEVFRADAGTTARRPQQELAGCRPRRSHPREGSTGRRAQHDASYSSNPSVGTALAGTLARSAKR